MITREHDPACEQLVHGDAESPHVARRVVLRRLLARVSVRIRARVSPNPNMSLESTRVVVLTTLTPTLTLALALTLTGLYVCGTLTSISGAMKATVPTY